MDDLKHECCVCMEKYSIIRNYPVKLHPCNHYICIRCCKQILKSSKKCPLCRHNFNVFIKDLSLVRVSSEDLQLKFPMYRTLRKNKKNEILCDKSRYSINVIDNNPKNLLNKDGIIYTKLHNNTIDKISGISTWNEIVHRTISIVDYNILRGINSIYYLLNPAIVTNYEEDIDYVIINPRDKVTLSEKKMKIINLLSDYNLRNNTSIDKITNLLEENIFNHFSEIDESFSISYNIITSGIPDNTIMLRNSLISLCETHDIFTTINLCGDDKSAISFYEKLNTIHLENIYSYSIILRYDLENKKIITAGNDIVNYTYDIHVARMAGCYNIISRLLSCTDLGMYYTYTFCNKILDIHHVPKWRDTNNYIKFINDNNYKVYSIDNKKVMAINILNLRWKIYTELFEKNLIVGVEYLSPISSIFFVMCITFLFCLIFF
tara:strand:- start:886 stop:2187 length:1302 start_codon:yes stop_codon:yes gene_type:complete